MSKDQWDLPTISTYIDFEEDKKITELENRIWELETALENIYHVVTAHSDEKKPYILKYTVGEIEKVLKVAK